MHRAKVPCRPRTGKPAKSNDRTSWGTFTQAAHMYQRGGYDGLGVMLADGLAGVDLDHCRDKETGAIEPWALAIMARFAGCYMEASFSGTGVHILCLGVVPGGRNRKGSIELYDGRSPRFLTVTGDALADSGAAPLADGQDGLNALYVELFPPSPAKIHDADAFQDDFRAALSMDDSELLTRARNHPDPAKAARFIALYDAGDTSGYKSPSEADAALCNDLAYMCGPTAEARVADLFRRSALYRDKADRDDYVERTIALAYSGRTAFYTPKATPASVSPAHLLMPSPTSTADLIQDEKHAPELAAELAGALARIAQLEAQVETLQRGWESVNEKQRQIRAIVEAPGDQVAPVEKLFAIEVLFDNVWRETRSDRDDEGYAPVVLETIAPRIGVSTSTAGKALDALEGMGAFPVKHDFTLMTKQGERSVRAIAAPAHLQPKDWIRPDGPRKHGGKREGAGRPRACVECGSTAISERVVIETYERKMLETHCPDCRHIARERIGADELVNIRVDDAPVTAAIPDLIQDDFQLFDATAWPEAPSTATVEASIVPHLAPSTPAARPCLRCRQPLRPHPQGGYFPCESAVCAAHRESEVSA